MSPAHVGLSATALSGFEIRHINIETTASAVAGLGKKGPA
jgi:hypothetical protein